MAAARTSTSEWMVDASLESDLRKYVEQNLKRSVILDFVKKDYQNYEWSLRSDIRSQTEAF